MPYIKQEIRNRLDFEIDRMIAVLIVEDATQIKGILNYTLTRIVAGAFPTVRYSNIADVIGALECVKLEYYARVARPYEDEKRAEEGDVKGYG